MRLLFTILLITAFCTSEAQVYLGKDRGAVKRMLTNYLRHNNYSASRLTETDSTVRMLITEPGMAEVSFTYLFDREDCIEELTEATCDSCFQKQVGYILARKGEGWEQLSGSTYISSRYRKKLLLLSKEGVMNRARLLRVNWKRKEYEELRQKLTATP